MRPELEAQGITVLALSTDPVDRAREHALRDELGFTLLADPEARAIAALGLVNPRGLEHHRLELFGIPLGPPRRRRSLAIPTSILVDEQGVVRWLDQAEDYRLRSDDGRVRAGINQAFD